MTREGVRGLVATVGKAAVLTAAVSAAVNVLQRGTAEYEEEDGEEVIIWYASRRELYRDVLVRTLARPLRYLRP